ncbi:MAG: methyltransferase domain-containing protein [Bacteroidales bacterium]|nr:methyltransferase domain-containing protein [Bacteroidales bacterium]
MNLFPNIEKAYSQDTLSAREAQRLAEFIAFGPIVFQTSRLMLKFGLLDLLRDGDKTQRQLVDATGLSEYAVKVLLEASLSIGTVKIDPKTDLYSLSKTGWFLITDPATRANIDFNHDVNYEGFFHLEEALKEGKPEGLKHFGPWPTIYEGLSSLPKQVQDSWFGFDHFYSDHSFAEALPIVFAGKPRRIMDVGGNTGRFSQQCVAYDLDVEMTIVDLPQQIGLMKEATKDDPNANRIHGFGTNLLDEGNGFPLDLHPDVIWMSQFLDCFSEPQILSILQRAAKVMDGNTRLLIMETFWDRQKYEPAAFCLTMTSLYFTVMANGNSKMYHSDDFIKLVKEAGLEVETIHDGLGQGHSIMVCKKK